jgi:hypothetical protein
VALGAQPFYIGINDSFPPSFGSNPFGTPFTPVIFNLFDSWAAHDGQEGGERRASIARGQAVFNAPPPFAISGVAGLNDVL